MTRKSIISRLTAAFLCMLLVITGMGIPVSAADPGINVAITVRNSNGNGIAGATVTMTSKTTLAHSETVTANANGDLEFFHPDWLSTEQYTITTYSYGYKLAQRTYTSADGSLLNIVLEEENSVVIPPQTYIKIKITVVNERDTILSNIPVQIQQSGGDLITYCTDQNGVVEAVFPYANSMAPYTFSFFVYSSINAMDSTHPDSNNDIIADKIIVTSPGLFEKKFTIIKQESKIPSPDNSVVIIGKLPKGTTVLVAPLSPPSEEYRRLSQALSDSSGKDWEVNSLGQIAGTNPSIYRFYMTDMYKLGVDISLVMNGNQFQPSNPISVLFNVGSKYMGRNAMIGHLKHDGTIEVFTAIVDKDGYAQINGVTSLSPFMVVIDDDVSTASYNSSSYNAPVVSNAATVTVTYKDYKTITYLQHQKIRSLPVPTKDGFIFGGWYKNPQLTNEFTSASRVTGNITLYPKWIRN